jgi:hypothetical protein
MLPIPMSADPGVARSASTIRNRLQPWFELVGGFKDAAQSARSTIYTVLA